MRGRVIGIDLGERRIGVSVSDSGGVLASPHSVIARSGDTGADHKAIADLVSELTAAAVVVGLPLSMSGAHGRAAQAAEAEATALEAELAVPVFLHDERLTTVEAAHRRRLSLGGGEPASSGPGRERSPRPRRRRQQSGAKDGPGGIDALAATVLLQSWLDQQPAEP